MSTIDDRKQAGNDCEHSTRVKVDESLHAIHIEAAANDKLRIRANFSPGYYGVTEDGFAIEQLYHHFPWDHLILV